ncbi:MAG: DUF4446 family protein [Candidatus Eremiobacteraeota bacterium]|nr:DUF4446 family protein [Candidatus Eremiobacteraeota bacterium]
MSEAIYAAIAAFVAALAALFIYHAVAVRPSMAALRRLLSVHDDLIAGGDGSAADRLRALESELADARNAMQRVSQRLGELEALAASDLSCVGFVRYDAFEDTGSDLSYALALLNRAGDGIVLSSIYSRTDTRTFGKAVKSFQPAANASEEEIRAIELARASTSNR